MCVKRRGSTPVSRTTSEAKRVLSPTVAWIGASQVIEDVIEKTLTQALHNVNFVKETCPTFPTGLLMPDHQRRVVYLVAHNGLVAEQRFNSRHKRQEVGSGVFSFRAEPHVRHCRRVSEGASR